MPMTISTTYTCENPQCPGNGVTTPASNTLPNANAPLPNTWYTVMYQGNSRIFHEATCAVAWLQMQPPSS